MCGNDYEPCRSAKLQEGVFRWREVSCSPECGAIYLRQINESRGILPKEVEISHTDDVDTKQVETEIVVDFEAEANALDPDRD